ncbi:MAG: multicopper oxidase family protein [Bacteroidetes bacterium]|nr:multicopper oxidase family protein [Bacteroidota bacterium]
MKFSSRFFALALLATSSVQAQDGMDHSMHMNHNMPMGDSLAWRMVPMGDLSMPMMPGMMDDYPEVGPMLPGHGMDISMFSEARPSEIIDMADGDTLHMDASLVRRTIGGQEYVMMAYGGMYPGPLIRADRGSKVIVEFTNNIEMPTTVHWHGLRLDNAFDGVPGVTQDPVLTGETFTYELKFPDTGMYWYHPHMREDVQQDLGLYGNMLVNPTEEDYYAPVNREVPLILDDILVDANGLVPYGDSAPTHALMGRFGNVMMVNGVTDYNLDVAAGEVVRFYLTNVANTRTFNVLFGGARIKVIAGDVSKYEQEQFVSSVVIAPAERYIVDVYFDEDRTYEITNTIQAVDHFRGVFVPQISVLGTVSATSGAVSDQETYETDFLEARQNEDTQADIESFAQYFDKTPDHSLRLTVEVNNLHMMTMRMMEIDTLYVAPIEWNDTMPMMNWLSTGEQVDWVLLDEATGEKSMEINWDWKVGDVRKIRLFNDPKSFHPMNHPFHVHGQRFVVTHVDGVPVENKAWKDTVIVPVGSTVDILVDVTNPGQWMAHCHIAEHLHAGMMLSFNVSE